MSAEFDGAFPILQTICPSPEALLGSKSSNASGAGTGQAAGISFAWQSPACLG
ncbi:MAG: hypothetical protein ABR577_00275 [Pyrinomonadaceae bacterium]